MDHLAVSRGHRLKSPLDSRALDVVGNSLGKSTKGGVPLLTVAADIDQNTVSPVLRLPLNKGSSEILYGGESGSSLPNDCCWCGIIESVAYRFAIPL